MMLVDRLLSFQNRLGGYEEDLIEEAVTKIECLQRELTAQEILRDQFYTELERLQKELTDVRRDGEQAARCYQNIGEEMFKVDAENVKLREALSKLSEAISQEDISRDTESYLRRIIEAALKRV